MKIKIENETNYVRDSESNAIINTNVTEYELYKQKRLQQMQSRNEIEEIKQDVRELKDLLQQMIRGLNDKSN